jgi:serine/threonine protein kinase
VFEYLKGGELFDRVVAKVVYPEAEAKVLFAHLLEAVAYMHDMGVVHRNLKPENIMLCEGKSRVRFNCDTNSEV